MEEKLISVIIPVYNVEKYLKRCVDSVINQTYKKLEIILIDDGSTDNSGKICDEYAKKDNRIIVIHKENGGVSSARNKGIDIASGEYMIFFDADDYMVDTALEKMIAIYQEYDVDFVAGNYIEYYVESNKKREINDIKIDCMYQKNEYLKKHADKIAAAPWNKLFKSKIIKENQLKFICLKIAEDLNFYMKYIVFCEKFYLMKDYICLYSIIDKSSSRQYDDRGLQIFDSILDIEEFYKKNGYNNKYLDLFSRIKVNHYGYQIGGIVQCTDKKLRKKMTKEFNEKNETNMFIAIKNKTLKNYIKMKLKQKFGSLYRLYRKIKK